MKRIGIVALALTGALAVACGAPGPPSGSGTTGSGSNGFGGSSFGGSTTGVGGGFAGGGGGKINPGVYTEAAVVAEEAPPPIAGGTLLILSGGHRAAVSDPDRDQIVIVDLDVMRVTGRIPLFKGDDPGRLVEDGMGRLHVALRAGRGVAVIDPGLGSLIGRLPVCALPRGLAYDATVDTIHVACAEGTLVSYASNGDVVRTLRLERDLRDVVVDGARLLVSRFRAAELLVVEANGLVSAKLLPATVMRPIDPAVPGSSSPPQGPFPTVSGVAWRTIPAPGGGAMMVHQVASMGVIGTKAGGYGAGCTQIISAAVSTLRVDGTAFTVAGIPTVLPVDVSATPLKIVVASAAWTPSTSFGRLQPYFEFNPPPISAGSRKTSLLPCGVSGRSSGVGDPSPANPLGRVVALAYDPAGTLVLQTREPATLVKGDAFVVLDDRSRKDTGHELFHLGTTGGIACASCHPEGHEDGQVWNFDTTGPRRTQSLRGGILGTEPFHWGGDMTSFNVLASDVFGSRMSGPAVKADHVAAMMGWIDRIPQIASPAAEDQGAVDRGHALFVDAEVGCATCHSGPKFTNNASMFVNTQGTFQVPSLNGLAWRAPYMHTGCAATLKDRFSTHCGGGDTHGKTSHLSDAQRADLVSYLETL